jgi:hypothetical protein
MANLFIACRENAAEPESGGFVLENLLDTSEQAL